LIKKTLYVSMVLFTLSLCANAFAAVTRDPIGVNVSASSPMSLTVRFAENQGVPFTTTQALFCFRLLENGQCDPGAILGRLPRNRDRGSTLEPTTRITDIMTIPYSVIRSALAIAQGVDFSDFYYVRRFTPAPGRDLGAGVNQDVFQRVTCQFAGPARIPLSVVKVELFGEEPDQTQSTKLIRLNERNSSGGRVRARIEHTGTGVLEGWWEVRRPGDPQIQEIDLLPEAALPVAQRHLQRRFTRVKKFRAKAKAEGELIIEGPLYSQLPSEITGVHEILLRFDATAGRENRSRLAVDGEPLNVFSGGVAGFSIQPLEYQTPAGLQQVAPYGRMAGRIIKIQDDKGDPAWRFGWRAYRNPDFVVEFSFGSKLALQSILAPADKGYIDLPSAWTSLLPAQNMHLVLRDPSGKVVSEREEVQLQLDD